MAIQIDGDSGVSGVNGSATTPALQGTDSNTGIVFGTDEVQIATGGSTRATVDSSGNFGIGESSADTRLHIKESTTGGTGIFIQNSNGATDSSADLYFGNWSGSSTTTPQARFSAINTNVNSAKTDLAISIYDGNNTLERARINGDGRLLIATSTAPSVGSFASTAKLVSQGNTTESVGGAVVSLQRGEAATSITAGEYLGTICFTDNAGSEFARIDGLADSAAGSSDYPGRLAFLTTADSASSPTERMRITSSGIVAVNRTAALHGAVFVLDYTNGTTAGLAIKDTQTSGTGVVLHVVNGSGTVVGGISQNQSTTSFNTSSDHRLKENIVDITDGIARVKQLQPRRFNFIANNTTTVDGFVAHEAQTVVPEAVTGTHNEVDGDNNPVYQGIDQSKLVPLLTAALQEAIGKIETLETQNADLLARVTALEAA